jgi:hypothetical protein
MPAPVSPENIADIRTLFFGRLAEINRDLIRSHADVTQYIQQQNHLAVLGALLEIEGRIQTMRDIAIVLRECLDNR